MSLEEEKIINIKISEMNPFPDDISRYGETMLDITGLISFEGANGYHQSIQIRKDAYDELKNYAIDGMLANDGVKKILSANAYGQEEDFEIEFTTATKDVICIKTEKFILGNGSTFGRCSVTINGLKLKTIKAIREAKGENNKIIK